MRVLVVDDELAIVKAIELGLKQEGYQVKTARLPQEALDLAGKETFDLVISDINMPNMDGLELVANLKDPLPLADFALITAFGTLENAIQAIRLGVRDFLTKPFKMEHLFALVRRVEEVRNLRTSVERLEKELKQALGPSEIVGQNQVLRKVLEEGRKIAGTNASVLVLGESGTGKELLARFIHRQSRRRDGPLVSVNCAAIPEALMESELFGYERGAFSGADRLKRGRVELAHGGTLFLDEIGDLSIGLQAKLLRFLEDRTFERVGSVRTISSDVRIISATNRNLETEIKQGTFRQDLFYRLNVLSLRLPTLAERKDDIPLLAGYFLKQFGKGKLKFSEEALNALVAYDWPGNIRELKNIVNRAVIVCDGDVVQLRHITGKAFNVDFNPLTQAGPNLYDISIPEEGFSLGEMEKSVILKVLEMENGVKVRAAKRLSITRFQLESRLKKYDIRGPEKN